MDVRCLAPPAGEGQRGRRLGAVNVRDPLRSARLVLCGLRCDVRQSWPDGGALQFGTGPFIPPLGESPARAMQDFAVIGVWQLQPGVPMMVSIAVPHSPQ